MVRAEFKFSRRFFFCCCFVVYSLTRSLFFFPPFLSSLSGCCITVLGKLLLSGSRRDEVRKHFELLTKKFTTFLWHITLT